MNGIENFPDWLLKRRLAAQNHLKKTAPALFDKFKSLLSTYYKKPPKQPDVSGISQFGIKVIDIANLKLSEQYRPSLFPTQMDDIAPVLNTAFFTSVIVLLVPKNTQTPYPVPLPQPTPSQSFVTKTIIIVEEEAEVELLEACHGPKKKRGEFDTRARSFGVILQKGARLNYRSYNDWQGLANLTSRNFCLEKSASLDWIDANTGHNKESGFNQIILNPLATVHLKSLAVTGKGHGQKLHYKTIQAEKTNLWHEAKFVTPDNDAIKLAVNHPVKISFKPDLDPLLKFYLTQHGFAKEQRRALVGENFMDSFLKDLPPEFAVEILSHI